MTTINKPINVLVYIGEGTTPTSIKHSFSSLRQLLSPTYAVLPLSSSALLTEPWQPSCAALVIPGGADLPYCRILNGLGNAKIRTYVEKGGKYIGLCAGAYYASKRCEFMQGHKVMEVVGDRELQFFPGVCRGLAFNGFRYQSEDGAKAAKLVVNKAIFGKDLDVPTECTSYYNGGGVFVKAEEFESEGTEVLASYEDKLDLEEDAGKAAVILCKVGNGHALLTAPHPEFAPENLDREANGPAYAALVDKIKTGDSARQAFFKACLQKLGLQVNPSPQLVPSLSPIHLSQFDPDELPSLLAKWVDIFKRLPNGEVVVTGENDTFFFKDLPDKFIPKETIPDLSSLSLSDKKDAEKSSSNSHSAINYDALPKQVLVHAGIPPSMKTTPSFNHHLFYSSLPASSTRRPTFGRFVLYAEVVTSTSTLLEKNHSLLKTLPTGLVFTADIQVAGRGRGSNVWVSPKGSLMFSLVLWHSASIAFSSPVVFVQYLAAMAVVRGVRRYSKAHAKLGVRLKWPNDVYAEESDGKFVKVSGVLVNSTYAGDAYGLVVGVGINVANAAPTVGLDALAIRKGLEPFQREKLLGLILGSFEDLYGQFCTEGWGRSLEDEYLGMWLHTNQIVTVETANNLRAKVKGITRDWGLLLAEELGAGDRETGHMISLQSDSNSFDFFKGLIKKKV